MARGRGHVSDAVRVEGLAEFRRKLRELEDPEATQAFKDANYTTAQLVVSRARFLAQAQGGLAAQAARTLRASRNARQAEVTLGGKRAPYAWGAEFGAYRNKLRLRKSTGGRTYIVRNESSRQVAKAIARIESQTRLGHDTVSKRRRAQGGEAVKVTGQMRGWNQFKEWRGNRAGAGYFLFPAIRMSADEIAERYGQAVDDISRKAFPEST